jgi:SH3-like domain-containing protein
MFLVTLPAFIGVMTRSKIGIVWPKNVPLRLTPTAEAEVLMKLAAGDAVRELRTRGDYMLVRTAEGQGWIQRSEFGRICPE